MSFYTFFDISILRFQQSMNHMSMFNRIRWKSAEVIHLLNMLFEFYTCLNMRWLTFYVFSLYYIPYFSALLQRLLPYSIKPFSSMLQLHFFLQTLYYGKTFSTFWIFLGTAPIQIISDKIQNRNKWDHKKVLDVVSC